MAWFETGEDGDISADEVMDDVSDALKALFRGSDSAPGSLSALLRVWQDALNAEARHLLSDAGVSGFRLRAEVAGPSGAATPTLRVVAAASSPSRVAARAGVLEALRRIVATYRDATGRAPRPRELAYALSFGFSETEVGRRLREGAARIHVVVEPLSDEASP